MRMITPPRLCLVGLFLVGAGLLLAEPPSATYNVRTYGAAGDGKTLDTDAINKAIDAAAAAGGGMVIFPAGFYASFSIHLKSNVALYLNQGATILAAEPPAVGQPGGYDAPEPNPGTDQYEDFGHSHWHNSLIWGENLQNIAILGPGRIFGRGLTRGGSRRRRYLNLLPDQVGNPVPGPFGYPNVRDSLPAGAGNKSIALKNCRNVILRDFTIYHGGHFGILVTGVDNLTIDNLKIDTNRDGMDIDCCQNVRVSDCTVNSPNDDGICLKASFGLGEKRATENVTITGCQVSGFEEGTLLDGTYQPNKSGVPTGRIKFGTEANGGFKNITISNCVFDYCLGLALEEVDGGDFENVIVSNLVMRHIANAPIFIRLGARLRGPNNPPVGVVRHVVISNIVATDVNWEQGILIAGIPGHPIQDLTLSHISIEYEGGGTKEQAARMVPEEEKAYPEPGQIGVLPSWGMFARHVQGLNVDHVELRALTRDLRPPIILDDVGDAEFDHVKAKPAAGVSTMMLKNVAGIAVESCPGVPDTHHDQPVADESL